VVTRRTKYDLNKAEERDHILQGLLIALDHIDEVIRIIRGSDNVQSAKLQLIERFGLSDAQAQAIVDMRLRALTGLEREKLENEYQELMEKISELKAILADEKKLLGVIKEEITVISGKYGDDRKTSIGFDEFDMSMEDLIPNENTIVAMTKLGYIKRMSVDNFKSQNRGGKGIKGMQTIDEDYIEDLILTKTHNYIMFFTNKGRVYRLKAYAIPEGSRTARGTAIVNLIQLQPGEKITAIIPMKEYQESDYLFMATKDGMVKKTPLKEYGNVRKNGLQAIVLRENDELIEVKVTPQREMGFDKIAERIYQYSDVTSVYLMSGGYDFTVMIEAKTMRAVAQFVAEKLSTIDSVLSTATHFILKKYKDHGTVLCDGPQDERMLIVP